MAVRFFLGVFEAAVTPGFALLLRNGIQQRNKELAQPFDSHSMASVRSWEVWWHMVLRKDHASTARRLLLGKLSLSPEVLSPQQWVFSPSSSRPTISSTVDGLAKGDRELGIEGVKVAQ